MDAERKALHIIPRRPAFREMYCVEGEVSGPLKESIYRGWEMLHMAFRGVGLWCPSLPSRTFLFAREMVRSVFVRPIKFLIIGRRLVLVSGPLGHRSSHKAPRCWLWRL